MLLLFLAGLALGSALFARLRAPDPARALGFALAANAFARSSGIALVPRLPFAYMRGFPAVQGAFVWDQALEILADGAGAAADRGPVRHRVPRRRRGDGDLAPPGGGVGRVTAGTRSAPSRERSSEASC